LERMAQSRLRAAWRRTFQMYSQRATASKHTAASSTSRPTSPSAIAHKQGRVAGENAIGGDRQFAGAIGTQSTKVFDFAIARTGLLDHEARSGGVDPLTAATEANDHKAYYPGAVPLHLLMSGDRATGRLLGAQILGHRKAEISKRIDIVAAALFQNAAVEDLNDMDLSYSPPFSSPWDPVQMAAQKWFAVWRNRAASRAAATHV
jgi:Pyridine nucleotide-disulphide oxidoreductase, dimerisation domain